MTWQYIGGSMIFALIGYLFGSISWAIIITKKYKKTDIRTIGSNNAGATNVVRHYGKKIGGLVFLLDVLKTFLAILVCYLIKEYSKVTFFEGSLVQISGVFVIIGHVFPVFFKFKGGKGAACLSGLFLSMNWILFLLGIIIFVIVLRLWGKVSIGSMVTPFSLILFQIAFSFIPHMNETWSNPLMQKPIWWVNTITVSISLLIIIIKHSSNIKKILNGTEHVVKKEKKS